MEKLWSLEVHSINTKYITVYQSILLSWMGSIIEYDRGDAAWTYRCKDGKMKDTLYCNLLYYAVLYADELTWICFIVKKD